MIRNKYTLVSLWISIIVKEEIALHNETAEIE